jgi:hypothetical protein
VDHLGHDDATRVTTADISDWVKALLAKPLSVKSVRDGYLPTVKIALGDAAAQRLILSNPALGVKVRGPKPTKTRSKGLTDAEAETILKAAVGRQGRCYSTMSSGKGRAVAIAVVSHRHISAMQLEPISPRKRKFVDRPRCRHQVWM